ncbi:MAG: motility associated factor glycosyltransferase family protein [Mobilitalea sp.]
MNYFENNMEYIKQYRSNLYQKLQEIGLSVANNKLDRIQSTVAGDGDLFLTIQKGQKQYRMNSSYSPKHEAEKWIEQYVFNNMNTVITLFGLGTGTFVREIIKNKGKNDILFIYEPCLQLFDYVLNNYDLTDILQEAKLVLTIEGINEFEFHNLLQDAVNITNITSQLRCTHPYYDEIFPESCIKYWNELKDNLFHVRTNINTEIVFGERFITNSMFNIRFIRESNCLSDLKEEIQTDFPAIIVAAGPSLKRNIEELKKAKGRAYIFVVDRILDYVLEEGLEPDYIITIDPIKPIEYFTKRTDLKIPLLCELVANWEVLDRHKGKKIIYSCGPFFAKMYEKLDKKPPLLNTGASVATTAFSACIQLGFKRIVLVGQDLAYDGEITHAGGVAEKIAWARDIMVEGIDGNQIRSRHDWYEFLTWFKDMITVYPDIQVIDVKDKGAKIQGSIVMPLKTVLDTYCTKEIGNLELPEHKPSTFNETEMLKVKKYFEDSLDEIYSLKKKAKEAIEICNSQIKGYKINHEETATSIKSFKKLSKINKYIGDQSIYELLESYITGATAQQISELYQFTDNEKTDKIVTYEKSIKIFQAIIDASEFVKPLLEEALKII